jgi:hypothetical protein
MKPVSYYLKIIAVGFPMCIICSAAAKYISVNYNDEMILNLVSGVCCATIAGIIVKNIKQ